MTSRRWSVWFESKREKNLRQK